MACFFSGTDMGELHENAPNYNYYLSLIVNFEPVTKWCAAIALILEEEQVGTVKRVGTLKTTTRYKGSNGLEEKFIENDINDEDVINKKNTFLVKINCDIEIDDSNKDHLIDRYIEISNKKKNTYSHTPYAHSNIGVNFNRGGGGTQNEFPFCETWWEKQEREEEEKKIISSQLANSEIRKPRCFSVDRVKPFLVELLGNSSDNISLDGAMAGAARDSESIQTWMHRLAKIEERFMLKIDEFFVINSNEDDAHCVAYTCIDILHQYHFSSKTRKVAQELVDLFDNFLLPKKTGIDLIRKELTGINEHILD